MPTTIAITGAGGFVGSRLAARLSDGGHGVHALLRDGSKADRFRGERYRVFRGDVTLPATVRDALAGCEIVVHCAVGGSELADAREINVEGTLHVLRAAADVGVRRVVHVSSVVAHGRRWPSVLTEDAPLVFSGDAYAQTKAEAERAATGFARNAGLELTIVRPTIVYGPRSGRILLDLERVRLERLALVDHGRGLLNMIYVDDLAEGLERAAMVPAARDEAFLLSGPTAVTCAEYFAGLARICGKPAPPSIALARARVESWWSRWHYRLTRTLPRLEDTDVAHMTQRSAVSIEKARRILGFMPPTSLDAGIRLTAAWLREAGYLPSQATLEAA